jgi:hypothetical protein
MPHTIRIYNVEATYAAGVWQCVDDPMQAFLESLVDPQEVKKGDPLHDLHHAHKMAKRLGGTVLGGPYPELEALDTLEKLEEEARLNAALEAQKPVRSSGGLQKLFGLVQRKFAKN